MELDKLKRANVLVAVIEQAEKNIRNIEEVFKASEIAITSATVTHKTYVNGKEKEEIKNLLIKKQADFLTSNKEEFENL